MPATPFLTHRVCGKQDALFLRQKARQVAQLLRYDVREQACVAAGAFAVAAEALQQVGASTLHFTLEQGHLHIRAEATADPKGEANSTAAQDVQAHSTAAPQLLQLVKPLPPLPESAEADIAWMVARLVQVMPRRLYEEIRRQNQDVLVLLHQLRSLQNPEQTKEEVPKNPSAA